MTNKYQKSTLTILAHYPRSKPFATIHPNDRLSLVYDKYEITNPDLLKNQINLIFLHGNGMNKSIWNQLIQNLISLDRNSWEFCTILNLDMVNHGESAMVNKHKLGIDSSWNDLGKDILQMIRYERETTNNVKKYFLVGHSMGGYSCLFANYLDPRNFVAVLAVEPVITIPPKDIVDELNDSELNLPFNKLYERFKNLKKQNSLKGYKVFARDFKNSFISKDERLTYYYKKTYWSTFEKKTLNDMANEDFYNEGPEFKLKTTIESQMINYSWPVRNRSNYKKFHKYLENPVKFLIGEKTRIYNLKDLLNDYISTWPKPQLDFKMIKEGTHLFIAEFPDVIFNEVVNWVDEIIDEKFDSTKIPVSVKLFRENFKKREEPKDANLESIKEKINNHETLEFTKKLKEFEVTYYDKVINIELSDSQRDLIFQDWYKQFKNGNYFNQFFVPDVTESLGIARLAKL